MLVVAAIAAAVVVPGGGLSSGTRAGSAHAAPGLLRLTVLDHPVGRIPLRALVRGGRLRARSLDAAVRRAVPHTETVRDGPASITYALRRGVAARDADRLGLRGGSVAVPARPVAVHIRTPVVAQREHNDCEATALQMLLATVGVEVDQARLQARMPRSGPLAPHGSGAQEVWGDPRVGFVGRPDGYGFGVYQKPVARVARGFGVSLRDLTGKGADAVYASLLQGHAVMAWIGLSDGPYGSWRSPQGRPVHVNFGEHAVVLTGLRADGTLEVANPLSGSLEQWSKAQFELEWARLGDRALTTPLNTPKVAVKVPAGSSRRAGIASGGKPSRHRRVSGGD